MSVAGLRRKPHYEEILALAHKDQNSQHGILGVGLQNFATRAINNPLFQRVQAQVEDKMQGDQRQLLEQRGFEHNVQSMAADQNVSQHDLNWVVQNIQRPLPPPVTPPPQTTEARIDYLRVAAEMDALMQQRAVQAAHQQVAAQAAQQMSTLATTSPAVQLLRDHHARNPPPTLAIQDAPMTISTQARRTGQSVHAVHAGQAIDPVNTPVPGLLALADGSTGTAPPSRPTRTPKQASSKPTRQSPYGLTGSPFPTPPGGFSGASSSRQSAPVFEFGARPASAPSPAVMTSMASAGVAAAARKQLLEIAKRHQQANPQSKALLKVIADKRRRRGGALGDVEPLGKRKEPPPPRAPTLLRPAAKEEHVRTRHKGGPSNVTQFFRIGDQGT